jgi:hypothetical protein
MTIAAIVHAAIFGSRISVSVVSTRSVQLGAFPSEEEAPDCVAGCGRGTGHALVPTLTRIDGRVHGWLSLE